MWETPSLFPKNPELGASVLADAWDWIARLYDRVWSAAWDHCEDGTYIYRAPQSDTRGPDDILVPARDLNLLALSAATTPPKGAALQRDLSVGALQVILRRNFFTLNKIRIQPYFFLCHALKLTPFESWSGGALPAALPTASPERVRLIPSTAHSAVFSAFLNDLREGIRPLVLAKFGGTQAATPSKIGRELPDFRAWANAAGGFLTAGCLEALWWARARAENIRLLELYMAYNALK